MAANLTIRANGKAEFVSGRGIVAWHKDGKVFDRLMTVEEAMRESGVEGWKAIANSITYGPQSTPTDRYKAIVRSDNGALLSVMRDSYQIVQYDEWAQFIQGLVSEGQATVDTMGTLGVGEHFFACLKLPAGHQLSNGDKTERYILVLTSHDGKFSLKAMFVTVRVVCSNTLSMALGTKTNVASVKHSRNWEKKKDLVAKILGLEAQNSEAIHDTMERLLSMPFSSNQMRNFASLVIPGKPDPATGKVHTRTQNNQDDLIALFLRGAGNRGETRFDALNAVTEYVDHARSGKTGASRIQSSLGNQAEAFKTRAVEILSGGEFETLLSRDVIPAQASVVGGDTLADILAR